jgi:RimJ/RimL family protein N-acetyltransferase
MNLHRSLIITSEHLSCTIRALSFEDVTTSYLEGLKKNSKFILHVPSELNEDTQKKYITDIQKDPNSVICGLFIDGLLVGTSGLQFNFDKQSAIVGVFIFNTNYRGAGLGRALVFGSCSLCYEELGITQFEAGIKQSNIPSRRLFARLGFDVLEESDEALFCHASIDTMQSLSEYDVEVVDEF